MELFDENICKNILTKHGAEKSYKIIKSQLYTHILDQLRHFKFLHNPSLEMTLRKELDVIEILQGKQLVNQTLKKVKTFHQIQPVCKNTWIDWQTDILSIRLSNSLQISPKV